MKILIIEDDEKMREELAKLLNNKGYETISINKFDEVVNQINETNYSLILLDINLPHQNGFEICKKLRLTNKTPIIFVTSRNTEEDELKSIISGGDDFITKPYNKMLLLEKIKRSLEQNNFDHFKEITVNDITLDLHLSLIKYNNKIVELTRNEFRIMYYFFLHPGKVITKDELIEYLWNDKYYIDETILLVNINRVRKKLKEINIADFIRTIRKEGYKI